MNLKHLNAEGTATCSLALSYLWAEVFSIDQRGSGNCSASDWAHLIKQAVSAASEKGAKSVVFRVIETTEAKDLIERLPELGFVFKERRMEYRAFLSDLPIDDGSPIVWRTAKDLGWTSEQVAIFLRDVAEGAPDFEPSEDSLNFIQDWINDPVLTAGTECVSIGFIEGAPASLVVAQVNPRTLWARLSYVGLIPKWRGNGLGKWIHRHGFAMLKAQGGDLYHGGTNAQNGPMIRLFETHGCRHYRRMQEWVWKPRAEEAR